MKKLHIAQDIGSIISRYGIFDIGEVQAEVSPSIETRGNLVSLLEEFRQDHAIVVVYDSNYSIVDTYRLSYIDMPLDTLKEVRALCLQYEEVQADLD
jgi:hypothetical protein